MLAMDPLLECNEPPPLCLDLTGDVEATAGTSAAAVAFGSPRPRKRPEAMGETAVVEPVGDATSNTLVEAIFTEVTLARRKRCEGDAPSDEKSSLPWKEMGDWPADIPAMMDLQDATLVLRRFKAATGDEPPDSPRCIRDLTSTTLALWSPNFLWPDPCPLCVGWPEAGLEA
jgi:hypothetical protein